MFDPTTHTDDAPTVDWPVRGGTDQQPWEDENSDVQALGGYPILTSGSQDPTVTDLGGRLALLGYPNSVSEGTNPFGLVDQSVMGAVTAFRRDYGVTEDPTGFNPASETNAAAHIGPWTATAIVLASDRGDRD